MGSQEMCMRHWEKTKGRTKFSSSTVGTQETVSKEKIKQQQYKYII